MDMRSNYVEEVGEDLANTVFILNVPIELE